MAMPSPSAPLAKASSVHIRSRVLKPQAAAGAGLPVYLSGLIKIKPSVQSDRRERISIHHNKRIAGVDFYFRVKIFFNIKRIFGVVVGGQFIVWMLG